MFTFSDRAARFAIVAVFALWGVAGYVAPASAADLPAACSGLTAKECKRMLSAQLKAVKAENAELKALAGIDKAQADLAAAMAKREGLARPSKPAADKPAGFAF